MENRRHRHVSNSKQNNRTQFNFVSFNGIDPHSKRSSFFAQVEWEKKNIWKKLYAWWEKKCPRVKHIQFISGKNKIINSWNNGWISLSILQFVDERWNAFVGHVSNENYLLKNYVNKRSINSSLLQLCLFISISPSIISIGQGYYKCCLKTLSLYLLTD